MGILASAIAGVGKRKRNSSRFSMIIARTNGTAYSATAGTRPMSIELEGKSFDKGSLYWSPLLFELVRVAATKGIKGDKLKEMLLCNYADGEGNAQQGYRFINEAGLSVQGQAANPAWRTIYHLVKTLGLSLDVVFIWEDKPKAAHPGKTARMRYAP